MNLQNPTNLRIGMQATFLDRNYKVIGRVVMGVRVAGEWYSWNEFNLEGPDGKEATLVYEADDRGQHWRIFTQFDPEYPMTAAEAAKVRLGDRLNLTGIDVRVTLVETSTVKWVDGRAPAGVRPGSLANYFNAEGDGMMQVVSWTGSEVEYYNGGTLLGEDVAAAFGIPESELVLIQRRVMPHWEKDDGQSSYLSGKKFGYAMMACLGLMALWLFADYHHSGGKEEQPVSKHLAGDQTLYAGYAGTLKNEHYKVFGHDLVEIAEPGLDYERHEYEVQTTDGQTALLVGGDRPNDGNWILFTPLQPAQPMTPFEAGAIRLGRVLNVDGLQATVNELFQARYERVDQPTGATTAAGDVWFNFSAKAGSQTLLVRWNANRIDYYVGTEVARSEIAKDFSVSDGH
jgi:hypothetical protein